MRIALLFFALLATSAAAAAPPDPETFLGHPVGADRKLAGWDTIVRYFEVLDGESERLELHRLGQSTLGRDLIMAVISSEANLRDAARHREIARRLADPRGLSEAEGDRLVREGKVIVLVTCNIHSSEIGSSQMAMEWAHDLVTSEDPAVGRWLDDVILLLMPSINPDGTDMIVDYYRKYVGTEWEGGRLPWLYHHYAGHDNNRDWFMLNLVETRIVNRVLHHEWFPQVFLDEHQMGATTPRIFVPPYADPHTPLVHPLQWRFNDLFGTHMALRLEQAGKSGVIDSYAYDAYWPGGTKNTACLKNVIGLLTEVSSCRIASPVWVDPSELAGGRKGLPDHKAQMNYPHPWPGGWWRLRDIVDYELIASNSLLETSSAHREEILRAFLEMGRDAVSRGRREPPYAYVIPGRQRDPIAARELVELLRENGLEAHRVTAGVTTGDGRRIEAGSVAFLAAQPYRPFLIEMMERQRYPEIRQGPDTREIFRPYDVTAWTLPLLMGVECVAVNDLDVELERIGAPSPLVGGLVGDPGQGILIGPETNAAYRLVNRLLAARVPVERILEPFTVVEIDYPAGCFWIAPAHAPRVRALAETLGVRAEQLPWSFEGAPRARLRTPRTGLYKPWAASMDEGWTRLVLDRHDFRYQSLDNAALRKGGLRERFDVIVLPDVDKNVILEGKRKNDEGPAYFEPLPPPYSGGIGREGAAALRQFVERGGTLVCLGGSADLAIEELNLPVRNTVAKLKATEFSVPGTLVNLEFDPTHPIAFGMPESGVAYAISGPVFATAVPGANVGRSVVARYPRHEDQVVASGWAAGTEHLVNRPAIVEAALGQGRVVLFGPRVQNRAQTVGTYKLLFNAILLGGTQPVH